MPNNDWSDLTSFDYLSLSPRQREEIRREAIRRAFAERAQMMDAVFMAVPGLIRRMFKRLAARKATRAVIIPGKHICRV